MIWFSLRNLYHRFLLYKHRINNSGQVYFKKHHNSQINILDEFNFGTKILSSFSCDLVESRLILENASVLEVKSAAVGRGSRMKLSEGAKVIIGRNTYLSDNSFISISTQLSIGDNCAISWEVQIFDDDGHNLGQQNQKAPIRIGNNVWIGSRAVILKGVDIGDHCVVAAGAVVTKSFPAGCLIGGVPAKVIRENIQWN